MMSVSTLKIIKADCVADLKVKIKFSDNTEKVVDFEPFIMHRPHRSFNYYRKPENFKKFKIEYSNVVWGENWDVILPVEQLYQKKIEF